VIRDNVRAWLLLDPVLLYRRQTARGCFAFGNTPETCLAN
jgi:hypothetical protein